MPARLVARALAWGALGAAAFMGCTLDWTVRPDPAGDGSAPSNDGGAEANDVVATEATDTTSTNDGGPDSGCAALQANVDAKKTSARACTLGLGQCQLTVKDACGCDVVVAQSTSAASTSYEAAVASLKNAGCTPSPACGPSCGSTLGRNCLSKEGGAVTECYPP